MPWTHVDSLLLLTAAGMVSLIIATIYLWAALNKVRVGLKTPAIVDVMSNQEVMEEIDKRILQITCNHAAVRFSASTCVPYGPTGTREIIVTCKNCEKEWPIYNGSIIQEEEKHIQRAMVFSEIPNSFKKWIDHDIFTVEELQAFKALDMLPPPAKEEA